MGGNIDRKAFNLLSYGVYAVGTLDGDRQVGLIVNSVMQITSQPKILALSVNKNNYSHDCILKNKSFSLSVLGEDTTRETIAVLGYSSSKDIDKWDKLPHTDLAGGLPILSGAVAYFTCTLLKQIDVETHTVFFAEVDDAEVLCDTPVMTYAYYHAVLKGKAPENAPTYQAEESVASVAPAASKDESTSKEQALKDGSDSMGKQAPKNASYACPICGYIYNDEAIPFESLPDAYTCPICGQAKSVFRKS